MVVQFPQVNDQENRPLDQVQITGMLLSCVIGIFPFERKKKQPVTVDICLYLDTRKAAESANIADTIDYAGALQEISFILEQCEFMLIETAVEAVCKHFLATYHADHSLPNVEAVSVRISKPSALAHGVIPTVQALRRRGEKDITPLQINGGRLYKVHSGADSQLDIILAHEGVEIDVLKLLPKAVAVLPLGRWLFGGTPVRARSSINLRENAGKTFKPSEQHQKGSKVLLIHSQA